jgi:hypothetical protein
MKKYVIKNNDRSEQSVMKAVHVSRKMAGQTLWNYLCEHNIDAALDIDDIDWVSPFDFIIEEVECEEVNETIKNLESARKSLGLRPLKGISEVRTVFAFPDKIPEDILIFLNEFNPHHLNALIALNKLFTIAQAWNKEDGFVPDFSDWEQDKWYPWFKYDKDAAGFVFEATDNPPADVDMYFGSRLCFKSSERAEQFGKQFVDLYNKVFL